MAITSARMQMRRGLEADFDPDKMQPGEWAVSLDKKYVRMCFSVGVCVRMATYDAFEEDMAQIEKILEECQTIEEAVIRIKDEIEGSVDVVAEYTEQAMQYRDEAKQYADEAKKYSDGAFDELRADVAELDIKVDTIIEKAELNIKNSASGENLHLTDSANGKAVDFGLYGKAEQFVGTITDDEGNEISVPNPDYPQDITVSGASGSVEVKSCGKNLLEITATSQTLNDVSIIVNDDKSIKFNGTASKNGALLWGTNATDYNIFLRKGNYILSAKSTSTMPSGTLNLRDSNETVIVSINLMSQQEKEFTIQSDVYCRAFLNMNSGNVYNNVTIYPMISFDGGEYEPYTETTSTIPTPNGLAGIKVSSGGNYTDENGQQWICDEVVKYADGSGKRIQRIAKAVLNGTESWGVNGSRFSSKIASGNTVNAICSHAMKRTVAEMLDVGNGFYLYTSGYMDFMNDSYTTVADFKEWLTSNNVTVLYELATPIITDLSAEEITEIEKMHTFYPVTNISNDADCGMSITYKADAQNYIDNRLALIESAMLNNI